MKTPLLAVKSFALALIAASMLSACGGGGSSSTPSAGGNPPPGTSGGGTVNPTVGFLAPMPATTPLVMSCVDGASFQCSGTDIIRIENGVGLTSFGVQAYGRSTSDLAANNPEKTTAYGMALASGGVAEIRLAKDSNGVVSEPRLLLRNLGISWNNRVERPLIVETFRTGQARTIIGADGAVTFAPLPAPSDYAFYDFADRGIAGTQSNYANNAYFPRGADNPPRCTRAAGDTTPCDTIESTGPQFRTGDINSGGTNPAHTSAIRLHGDGDVHAGNGTLDQNGNPTILPGGSGIGVPFPGSKGYRSLDNWSLRYANLSTWVTQDTVSIVEWAPGSVEHSKIRRGTVAFGDVTLASKVPTTGAATYVGVAYGWYARDGSTTTFPAFFRGAVRVTTNFVTREVKVTLVDSFENVSTMPALPAVDFHTGTKMGSAGTNVANYFTGAFDNGSMAGGVSGRYFGPVVTGTDGTAGPAEMGGTFRMAHPTNGAAVVGGFIALKR
ncbi:MAG: hypothetical protein JWM42_322 [Burkholderia sp.]|nr:hypothetical protein [Burkholderia sp.]